MIDLSLHQLQPVFLGYLDLDCVELLPADDCPGRDEPKNALIMFKYALGVSVL
jgi:hypothetical protein